MVCAGGISQEETEQQQQQQGGMMQFDVALTEILSRAINFTAA